MALHNIPLSGTVAQLTRASEAYAKRFDYGRNALQGETKEQFFDRQVLLQIKRFVKDVEATELAPAELDIT